jgi:radical SAM protein with 4Fe4S-binding SPASM domain
MPEHFNFDQIKVLVTSACNSNCTHCFRGADKNKYVLSESKLIEIVDFAIANYTQALSFSGGEFFTHPFAYGLLEYCLAKKIPTRVLTNATDLNLLFFEKRKDINLLSIQVSIDGMKYNHDLRRGEGSFDATIHNVKGLSKLGIPITAKMTLDEHNYTDVIDVINMPYFTSYSILPVALTSAAKRQTEYNSAVVKDYEKTINLLYKKQTTFADKTHRCRIFPHTLAIKYDGNVYPCGDAREHSLFCMGNITTRSLHETIQDYVNSENSKILQNYVSNDIFECNNCHSKIVCNRGCRVRAYKFNGEFLSPDPFCCRIFNDNFSDISMGCLFWGEKESI